MLFMSSSNSIVIFRLGSLGDTIVALPCFHKIAEAFPNEKKIVLTNFPVSNFAAPIQQILNSSGLIDDVIEYPLGLRSIKEFLLLRKKLKNTGSNTLIYLSTPRGVEPWKVLRDIIFFRLCGFSNIIGAPISEDLVCHRIDPKSKTVERESERLARTLSALGEIDLDRSSSWDLKLTKDEFVNSQKILGLDESQKFFAINMGGKVTANDWGLENWSELVTLLSANLSSLQIVIIGGADDWKRGEEILRVWDCIGVNLCGLLSPRESAAVLSKALFFIGHDSGPLHLAAAMQTTCIGLYGNNKPANMWHPYGSKHIIHHEIAGVRFISPHLVLSSVLNILN